MVAYLTKSEIDSTSTAIREEFGRLLADKEGFARQPDRKRWVFLRHCFQVLMGECSGDFSCDPKRVIQYKSQISQKLEKYYREKVYLKTHKRPVRYTFFLQSRRYALDFPAGKADYPSCNNYFLLVSSTGPEKLTPEEVENILQRTVDGAIHAEFSALQALPDKEKALEILGEYFEVGGPAYKRILETIEHHLGNGEVLSNPRNPSIGSPKSIKIISLTTDRAIVHTKERWYLKWWSPEQQTYAPWPHKCINHQTYTLVNREGGWLVRSNIYGTPNNRRL